ncbi:HipA protein [Collimonas arenae]|uniref:HipA protein n=1 Tax=Collimonas arenae TaxID=279058 RepID=A0A0A1F3Q3_9BURK|nr:HipA domain-containing protein [Collimonas arenae]AIY39343.1 HipA protein [Collimonas arenae]
MNRLGIFLDDQIAGWVTHDPESNQFAFSYSRNWLSRRNPYPLSPFIPLEPEAGQTAEAHSAAVRQFFENLLPEGHALDDAATANKLSKANLVGLMLALGKETAGALRIQLDDPEQASDDIKVLVPADETKDALRPLTRPEMSERIRSRPYEPFSVWDGKVRLSIAGFQDKIAVYKEKDEWFLVESGELASTVILKPEPVNRALAGLPSNEFYCMRLARNVGLPVANVRLVHVPEPILEVDRFDRIQDGQRVRRLHIIDGCQALGISVGLKYERPYGDSPDVKNIRDGASLPRIFKFLQSSANPAAQRLLMLRWAIFQVLIGNTDAHAKNISFFCQPYGFVAAPAYDLVSILACSNPHIEDSFAMAIGDAFTEGELSAYEWANFAASCGLRPQLVAKEMQKLIRRMDSFRERTAQEVIREGADAEVAKNVCNVVQRMSLRHARIAEEITGVDPSMF